MTADVMHITPRGRQAEFVAVTKWKTGETNEAGKISSQTFHRLL